MPLFISNNDGSLISSDEWENNRDLNEDEEITMGELSKKLMGIIGKNLIIHPLPSTPGSPKRRCPSISRLKEDTNFDIQYQLDEGLKETYNWYKSYIFSGKEKSAQ